MFQEGRVCEAHCDVGLTICRRALIAHLARESKV